MENFQKLLNACVKLCIIIIIIAGSFAKSDCSIKVESIGYYTGDTEKRNPIPASIIVRNSMVYVLASNSKDLTAWSGGFLMKMGMDGQYYYLNAIGCDSLRLVPKSMSMDYNGEITVLSEEADFKSGMKTPENQRLNMRKYSPEGVLIYNFTDTSRVKNVSNSYFPIGFDQEGKPIVICTDHPETVSITYMNNYDSTGSLIKSVAVDSSGILSIAGVDTLTEKFEIHGFKPGPGGSYYCFGARKVISSTNGVDNVSGYAMAIDSLGKIKWKIRLYSSQNGIDGIWLSDFTVLDNGNIVFVGADSNDRFTITVNANGEIIRQKNFGSNNYFVNPYNIIQSSKGDLFVVGSAGIQTEANKRDKYIAKISSDGDLIWENRAESPLDQKYSLICESTPDHYLLVESRAIVTEIYSFFDDGSDVPEPTSGNETQVLISPNPVGDFISIKNCGSFASTIQFFNTSGFKVLERESGEKTDVSSLPPGLYFFLAGNKIYKFLKI